MPVLESRTLFEGADEINPDELGLVEVNNFNSNIDKVLRDHYKWQGKAVATIGLSLSPDNSKVTNGFFIVRGNIDLKEIKFACSHIWPECTTDATLAVSFPSANIFIFEEGGLWSNIVPASSIVHSYHSRDGSMMLGDERERHNIGEFSARMICQLSSTSQGRRGIVIKYMIVIFPSSADELASSPESRMPGWPGLKVGEGTFPLAPRPRNAWRCPVIPFIRPGAPFTEIPMAPTSNRLRAAISAIMRKAGQPDNLRSGANVLEKWEQIRMNPRIVTLNDPLIIWPQAAPVLETQGKNHCS